MTRRETPETILSKADYDAVLFDLDGVVTKTAKVHAAAWKELFDEFLRRRKGDSFRPFDLDEDYHRYVDGKPRYDGVQSFLESRGIHLPYGSPEDPPEKETVCGLGNKKNRVFTRRLEKNGVEVYPSTVDLIRSLRGEGFKTAIVSSSKNCEAVLAAAGLSDLFDTRVDGVVSAERGLTGKPAPDIFLEAARRLGVVQGRAVVVEDAISGVQAGRRGRFGLVMGVDRTGQGEALLQGGADVVVKDLEEVKVGESASSMSNELPSGLERIEEILGRARGKKLVFFLDYDGTLTPIVQSPDKAVLSEEMGETLRRLAGTFTVAIISGRDLSDIQERVGSKEIVYAGSHGFDIAGPEGLRMTPEKANAFLPALDKLEQALRRDLGPVPGCLVERKRFSVAVHYRQVQGSDVEKVEKIATGAATGFPDLRKSSGKKIFEFQPDMDWNKGKAVLWLLEALGLRGGEILPLYIGDDTTDEDAFRELEEKGIGILVRDGPKKTEAQYALESTEEVRDFLDQLISRVEEAMA